MLASVPGYVQVTIAGQAPALGFVANLFDATVTPFDLRTHATGPPITVGQFPRDLALSPNRKRLYVADNASNELSVVDAASQAVITTVAVGKGPWAVAVSPDSAAAWVTNATDNTVQAIDAATLRARDPIPVGTDPQALAISPDGKQLYVANTGSGDVTVVNTKTSAVSEPIAAGARPRAITVSPDGKTLYEQLWRRFRHAHRRFDANGWALDRGGSGASRPGYFSRRKVVVRRELRVQQRHPH